MTIPYHTLYYYLSPRMISSLWFYASEPSGVACHSLDSVPLTFHFHDFFSYSQNQLRTLSIDTWRFYFTGSSNFHCHQEKIAFFTHLCSKCLILTCVTIYLCAQQKIQFLIIYTEGILDTKTCIPSFS